MVLVFDTELVVTAPYLASEGLVAVDGGMCGLSTQEVSAQAVAKRMSRIMLI